MSDSKKKIKVMSKDSRKRLQKDIIDIIKNPLTEHGIYYTHDDSNMLKGYAVIFGPTDTIYRYGAYMFEIKFPSNYPVSPPKLTYLTNDGSTRFHPNLYRNGKVCLSVLNTWRGEGWTSCQTIRSILLILVTLFHNKPLLNEPGIKETHHSFKPYNKIITYRNVEHSIIKTFWTGMMENGGPVHLSWFFPFYKKYINEHKDDIIKYIQELNEDKEKNGTFSTSIYGLNCKTQYDKLLTNFKTIVSKLN
uniref:Ubiquitin-conjugating enzyme E2 Z n=1 Tax=viral metagenome TaxID=1070528 RepID=A0A6C0KFD0_9ZZZZ